MATRKPIKWAKIGKVAGLVVAGVLALAAGAIPVWNQVPIRRLPPRDGGHEENVKGQAGACPDRARAIPCKVRVSHNGDKPDVPATCPIGRSSGVCHGHQRTARPPGSGSYRVKAPIRSWTCWYTRNTRLAQLN